MTQSIKYILCKHEELSSTPTVQVKPGCGNWYTVVQNRDREVQKVGSQRLCWLASLAKMGVCLGLVRDIDLKHSLKK